MKYRSLGNRNPSEVSILGFGCMRLPHVSGRYSQIIKEKAKELIRYSIDNGINYIDTAYPYHDEMSEPFVGEVLQDGYRKKVFLATKMPSWSINSYEDLDKYFEIQLDRLKTDYIDFYLLHALNKNYWENYKKVDVFSWIDKKLKSGQIKNIGFSFHDKYEVFEEIIHSYNWDFCQIQLNFLDEEYQAGLKGLKLASEKNIGVIVMEPLRGGRLANNVADTVKEIYDNSGSNHTPAGWALRYIWNYTEVKTVLSGMNEMDQIIDNLAEAKNAYENMLTPQELSTISEVKDFYQSRIKVNCTDCKYCMPCPHGVNIPGCFFFYNNASIFNDKENFKKYYISQLKEESRAEMCQECGICETKCPQGIEIINQLKAVHEYFNG